MARKKPATTTESELRRLVGEGWTIRAIALALKRPEATLYAACSLLGIYSKPGPRGAHLITSRASLRNSNRANSLTRHNMADTAFAAHSG
jgi:hypothetical protein